MSQEYKQLLETVYKDIVYKEPPKSISKPKMKKETIISRTDMSICENFRWWTKKKEKDIFKDAPRAYNDV
jgi:hypothetical protein